MATSKNIRYIPAIDHLRAFAALMVLLFHTVLTLIPVEFAHWPRVSNPFQVLIYEGHTGVALFLVLSGFIFTYGSAGREIEYKTFLLNRILRIYPLMIALTFIGVSAYGERINATQVIESLLPVQNLHGTVANVPLGNYNLLFWTISVEFQFYLIFPFLYRQLLRRGILGLAPLMVFLILARWSAYLLGANPSEMSYYTIVGRLDQFLIGMIAATVALRLNLAGWLRWFLPLGLVGLLAALFLYNQAGGFPVAAGWKVFWPPVEASLWALIILGYLTLVAGRNGPISKALAALGTISYSMYLIHVAVIDTVKNYGLVFHFPHAPFLSALTTGLVCIFPLAVLVSTLSYHAIEKPFLELRRRYVEPPSNAQPVPAGLNPPPALAARPMAVEAGTEPAAHGTKWLAACLVGVGAVIVTAILLARHLGLHDDYDPVTNSSMHLNVERAIAASDAGRPSGCKVLMVPDESGGVAVDVGLQLTHAGVPFVVTAGRWRDTFGAQHAWPAINAHSLKGGLCPWYIVPHGSRPSGLPADAPAFPLRDGAVLIMLPRTLELSAVGSTAEISFTSGGNGADFALGGWSNPDQGGCWTEEKWTALAFHPQVVEGARVELFVDGQPLIAPAYGVTRQRVRLFFNGLPIEPEQQLTAPSSVPFIIPAETWNAAAKKMDAVTSLAFELPDAVAPASLGPHPSNDDIRKLGLYVSKVRLQVAP